MAPLPHLILRADAGPSIGAGHMTRSLALAEAWADAGGRVAVVTRCALPGLAEKVRRMGDVEVVDLDVSHPDRLDAIQTAEAIARMSAEGRPWVVVDGYQFDAEYVSALRSEAFVCVIDDLANDDAYDADLVLNPNVYGDELWYPQLDALVFGGAPAVLIRRELKAERLERRFERDGACTVLVALGGGLHRQMVIDCLRALSHLGPDRVRVLVAPGFFGSDGDDLGLDLPIDASFESDPSNLPSLMAQADLAISSGGVTASELAFMGTPSILLVLAENQSLQAGAAERLGFAVVAGSSTVDEERLADRIAELCRDAGRRERMSGLGMSLIDGAGALRAVALMRALSCATTDELLSVLRPLEAGDELGLWRLANQRAVRANAIDTRSIELAEHRRWFRGILRSAETVTSVVSIADVVCAQVRYGSIGPGVAEVHVAVAGPLTGRGLGTRMLVDTRQRAMETLRASTVRAHVVEGNANSIRAFTSAGYGSVGHKIVRGKVCEVFEFSVA